MGWGSLALGLLGIVANTVANMYATHKQADIAAEQAKVYNTYLSSQIDYGSLYGGTMTETNPTVDEATDTTSKDTTSKAELATMQEQERVNPLTVNQLLSGNKGILGSWLDEENTNTSRGNLLNI